MWLKRAKCHKLYLFLHVSISAVSEMAAILFICLSIWACGTDCSLLDTLLAPLRQNALINNFYDPINAALFNVFNPIPAEVMDNAIKAFDAYGSVVTRNEWLPEYDYVIVGGGSAGCVLANRLSENPSVTVLLLEAGSTENFITDIPLFAPAIQKTSMDWAYQTVPQKHSCFGLKERRSTWPRGKVLGGTSALNFMMYVRGNSRDFDSWDYVDGAEGWSYSNVLPYFKKAEDLRTNSGLGEDGLHIKIDEENHGKKGPLAVERPSFISLVGPAIVEAGRHMGYDVIDYNGKEQTGFSLTQSTLRDHRRGSASKSYLHPVTDKRENLHVLTNSFVTKIVIEVSGNEKRAVGILFDRQGSRGTQVRARREVIISGGSINSPQLLMLSGIGPKDHLRMHNIPLVVDLPGVGQNLQDHVGANMPFLVNEGSTINAKRIFNPSAPVDYITKGTGPLSSPVTLEATAFINTTFASDPKWPDIQFLVLPIIKNLNSSSMRKYAGYSQEMSENYDLRINGSEGYFLFVALLRPESRGYIELNSSDPYDKPIIDPTYFSDKNNLDIRSIVEGMKIALKVTESPSLRKIGSNYLGYKMLLPGCGQYSTDRTSDDALECVAKTNTETIWHPTSTCSMGNINSNPMAVVSPQLKVYGVKELRVVDASVMPRIVSANTNAAVIMMAEKAADMIKAESRF